MSIKNQDELLAAIPDDILHKYLKKCSRCGKWKYKKDFTTDNSRADNLKFWCIKCCSKYNSELYRRKRYAGLYSPVVSMGKTAVDRVLLEGDVSFEEAEQNRANEIVHGLGRLVRIGNEK